MKTSAVRSRPPRDDSYPAAAIERFLRRLLTATTVSTTTQAAVDAVRECLDADLTWCGVISGDSLTMAAHNGLRTTEMMAIWRLKVGQGVGGRVARDGKPLITRDYKRDPRRVPVMKSLIDAEGLTSALVVPVLNGTEVLGAIWAGQREVRDWTSDEQDLAATIGRDTGLALGRMRKNHLIQVDAVKGEQVRQALKSATALASLLIASDDISDGIGMLSQQLGRPLELVDSSGQLLRAIPPASAPRMSEPLWEKPFTTAGLSVLRIYGERPLAPVEEDLAELGANVIALQIMRERAALRESVRLHGELLNDIFDRRPTDPVRLRERAALLGLDLSAPHFVACIGRHRGRPITGLLTEDSLPVRLTAAESLILRQFPETIVVARPGHIALLIPAETAEAEHVRAVLLRALRAEPCVGLAGGLGRTCLGITDYADSYQEATAGLQAARQRAEPGELLSAADIGFLGLLAHASGPGFLDNVVEDALSPLLDMDAGTGSEYVKTLDAYLACDRHLDRTATALHVHPNTVRYRIGKVQEKLGADLHDVEVRFLLELALRVHATMAASEPTQ